MLPPALKPLSALSGAKTLEENLQFIADSLCLAAIQTGERAAKPPTRPCAVISRPVLQRPCPRPTNAPSTGCFGSGKRKAFECLVYLRRYNEATLPRMRTRLREHRCSVRWPGVSKTLALAANQRPAPSDARNALAKRSTVSPKQLASRL